MNSQPLDSPENLTQALYEQGETEEEIKDLTYMLWKLREWKTPEAEPDRVQALITSLQPLASPLNQNQPRNLWGEFLWLLEIARLQVSILKPAFWLISGVVMLVGALFILFQSGATQALLIQALAPGLAYLSTVSAFRGIDLGLLEFELACPPSPRLLTLARLVVVLGYDTLLGLLASLLLWTNGGGNLLTLALHWLAPLLLVTGLMLLLSLRLPISRAAGIAYGGWLMFLLLIRIIPDWENTITINTTVELSLVLVGLSLTLLALVQQPTSLARRYPRQ